MPIRTLTFEQISDSRFNGSEQELTKLSEKVLSTLSELADVKVQVDKHRLIEFNGGSIKSWRQRFFVQKNTRKTTWEEVYSAVNAVKAAPYDFVYMHTFSSD